jgi:hypothetical protein
MSEPRRQSSLYLLKDPMRYFEFIPTETSVFDRATTTKTFQSAACVLIIQGMAELQVLGDVLSLKFLITGGRISYQDFSKILVVLGLQNSGGGLVPLLG